MPKLADFSAQLITGQEVSLEKYLGSVLLIVNTASKCGFTKQYEGLEKLWQKYRERGLVVLGFPCDQFGGQEFSENSEVLQYCTLNFGVSFPLFSKITVNGAEAHPLFKWLKQSQKGFLGASIKWNFTKFLINRQGHVVARFAPQTSPENLESQIIELLSENI